MKINKISPQDNVYTKVLTHIAKPPKSLYFIGKLPKTRRPSVAIVGSRKPTAYGSEVTHRFAYELAARDCIVISGLALGVDGIAHKAALEAGGTTLAVLGNGLPDIYPVAHKQLAAQIIEQGGAILSEYEPGMPALGHQFLERNRIVSALSDAILITEAASRSGTLNTAAHALTQGKDVFVIPGNITSPMSAGCNALIKQGAHVATTPEDILEIIAPTHLPGQNILPLGNTPEETAIITLLQAGIRDGNELQRTANLDASVFATTLTMLELAGTIRALGSNQWTLR